MNHICIRCGTGSNLIIDKSETFICGSCLVVENKKVEAEKKFNL